MKLPVTVGWPERGGDATSMLLQVPGPVVNIDHSRKVLGGRRPAAG